MSLDECAKKKLLEELMQIINTISAKKAERTV